MAQPADACHAVELAGRRCAFEPIDQLAAPQFRRRGRAFEGDRATLRYRMSF
jgi:hypothetical protein